MHKTGVHGPKNTLFKKKLNKADLEFHDEGINTIKTFYSKVLILQLNLIDFLNVVHPQQIT